MRPLRIVSAGLIVIGLALLALAGGYYAYATVAKAQLKQLAASEVSAATDVSSPAAPIQARPVRAIPKPEMVASEADIPRVREVPLSSERTQAQSELPQNDAVTPPLEQQAQPTASVPQKSPVYSAYLSSSDTYRISIPSIGVESRIVELGAVWEKGEWAWQTPDHAVGHLKGTASPGEVGNVVMSGHISSPLKGEGSVFKNLPNISVGALIILSSSAGEFAYQVVEKRVVEPADIWVMAPTPEPILTLITCVPDWVYTHRLVVTALPARVEPLEPPRR